MSSAQEVANHLHKAIEAKNVHELIEIIASYENDLLVEVAHEYTKLHGKALAEEVKSVAHGEFGLLLIDLIIPRANFAARVVNNAVAGAGTDEKAIIDVIAHISNQQIAELKDAFSNIFAKDLVTRVKSDLSGHFGKAVVSILEGTRSEHLGDPRSEAETLYSKGEGKWGTDDDYFVNFFTKNSFENLVAIDEEYQAKYGHSLEVAVKKETSGAYQDLLVALSIPRPVFWARRIRHAIAGLGTDDTLLRRAFALNSRKQLQHIQAVYESVNKGKNIHDDVAGDTSAHYKTLFLALLK